MGKLRKVNSQAGCHGSFQLYENFKSGGKEIERTMLRANALFIVVVVALIIGIMCSSLIVLSYYQRLQVQKDLLIKRIDVNANSALNILLSDSGIVPYGEERLIDLYGDEKDSVILKKIPWGIFEIGAVSAFSGSINSNRSVLIGYKLDEKSQAAIYLMDQILPLKIRNNTVINGTCYLPKSGVKVAEGQSFSGKNLINGEIKNSDFSLPPLNKKILETLSSFLEGRIEGLPDSYEIYTGEIKDTIIRSFAEKTLIIRSNGDISLEGKNYEGNIIISSDRQVQIDATSKLSDILIFAKAATISDNFIGNVQLFCRDSILTGRECNFLYPSVMGLLKNEVKPKKPFITIGQGGKFKGIIFTYNEIQELERTLVTLEKNTEVEGQIYADGYIDSKGSVFGNITCYKFSLQTPSTEYINYLSDCTIDAERLSPYFVGSSLISSNIKKGVVKCLE